MLPVTRSRKKRRRGFLFVFEGIDGAGKTAVCNRVAVLLRQAGFDVVQLHEPTSESRWGQEIRERSQKGELTPAEELELFLRDREWHVEHRIRPALSEGKLVLMDRYFFASGAYQTTSTGIDWRDILRRNREEIKAPEPDLVFLLDISAEEGLNRVGVRSDQKNKQFEQLDRLVRVRQAYLEMVAHDSGHFHMVDARQPLDSVVEVVYTAIDEFMKRPPVRL